jgi:branched-subunit amino acid ABC-type transport system permease component
MNDYLFYSLLPQVFHGLVWGMALALVAIGLSLVFGVMKIVNFAHGELCMMGAYVAYSAFLIFQNFWLAMVFSMGVLGVVGFGMEYFAIRPLYGKNPMLSLLVTFGISMILVESARIIWGPNPKELPAPLKGFVNFAGLTYPTYRLFLLFFSIALVAAIWLFLNRSRYGIIIQGASQDREMLSALGVNVGTVYSLTFVLGAALAAVGGIILGPILAVYPTMGLDIILSAFAVVIVGGMGSFPGAVVASIIIGEVESLGSLWIPPTIAKTLTFVMMAIILLFRPEGLFGEPGAK